MDTSMSDIGKVPYTPVNPVHTHIFTPTIHNVGRIPGICGVCQGPIRDHAKDCPARYEAAKQAPDAVEDIVVKPSHYARWAIEPITFIMRNGFEFWRGNATKYIARAGYKAYAGKSQVESEITDLEKAIRCLQMRVNQLKGDTVL